MKNCPKCNHPLIDSAKFCQKCGSAVAASKVESEPVNSNNTKLPPAPPPLKRKAPAKRVVEIDEVPPPKNETTEKKGKNPLLGVVLLVVIFLVLYGTFSNDKKEEAPLPQAYVDPAPAEPVPAPTLPNVVVPADSSPQGPGVGPAERQKAEADRQAQAVTKTAFHGYASIYQAEGDNNSWAMGAGYQTQEQADNETLANCQKYYPGKACSKRIGGAYKCAAVGISSVWLSWNLGDDLNELKSSVISSCKEHGGDCVIDQSRQVCSSW